MKRKKVLKWVFVIVGIFIVVYISIAAVYGAYLNTLFHEIYDSNNVYTDNLAQKVNEDIYALLDFRNSYANDYPPYDEHVSMSFPLVAHWGLGGVTRYVYSYERTDQKTNEMLCGSWDIPVTVWFHLDGLNVVIDDIYEAP